MTEKENHHPLNFLCAFVKAARVDLCVAAALVAAASIGVSVSNHADALASACETKLASQQSCSPKEREQYNVRQNQRHQFWLSNQCDKKKGAGENCTQDESEAWEKEHPKFQVWAVPIAS